MAINLQQLESTGRRWGAPTQDYPQGRFLNGSGSGSRDGSYAKAEWANEIFGVFGAILTAARMKIDGTPETATKSQVLDVLKTIIKNEGIRRLLPLVLRTRFQHRSLSPSQRKTGRGFTSVQLMQIARLIRRSMSMARVLRGSSRVTIALLRLVIFKALATGCS